MIKIDEKLKLEYDKKSIGEIENGIKSDQLLSLEAKKEMVFALLYLRNTGRYKENPFYKKSSFKNYLLGFFNIRLNTFMEEAAAFTHHEKESLKYGVGLVSKISRQCGAKHEQVVLDEIEKIEKTRKTPIQRDKIDAIIAKYTPLGKVSAQQSYKTLYQIELKNHEITKQRFFDVTQELKQAKKQIEKLKKTVLELRPLRDMKEAILPFLASKKRGSCRKQGVI